MISTFNFASIANLPELWVLPLSLLWNKSCIIHVHYTSWCIFLCAPINVFSLQEWINDEYEKYIQCVIDVCRKNRTGFIQIVCASIAIHLRFGCNGHVNKTRLCHDVQPLERPVKFIFIVLNTLIDNIGFRIIQVTWLRPMFQYIWIIVAIKSMPGYWGSFQSWLYIYHYNSRINFTFIYIYIHRNTVCNSLVISCRMYICK